MPIRHTARDSDEQGVNAGRKLIQADLSGVVARYQPDQRVNRLAIEFVLEDWYIGVHCSTTMISLVALFQTIVM